MYAELEINFEEPIGLPTAQGAVQGMVGNNRISVDQAIEGTALAGAPGIQQAALAAEHVPNVATIIYFMEGGDIVKAHIMVKSLVNAKKQCVRITRQLTESLKKEPKATASILVEVGGSDEAVIQGEKLPAHQRWWDSVSEKFVSRFLPAGVTFGLAALFLKGTTTYGAALIGMTASLVVLVIEGVVAAKRAGDWKWKDVS